MNAQDIVGVLAIVVASTIPTILLCWAVGREERRGRR